MVIGSAFRKPVSIMRTMREADSAEPNQRTFSLSAPVGDYAGHHPVRHSINLEIYRGSDRAKSR